MVTSFRYFIRKIEQQLSDWSVSPGYYTALKLQMRLHRWFPWSREYSNRA